jgi:hypothetical protein
MCIVGNGEASVAPLLQWRKKIMILRQLMFAVLFSAVLAGVGCSCCRGTRAAYPPPCGCGPAVPAGPAVAVPAAPTAVSASCPTCVGR